MKSGSSRKHTSGNVGSTLTIKSGWLERSVWSSACGDIQTWMKVPKRDWTNSNSYTFVTLTLGRGNMYISDRASSDHALSASSRQKCFGQTYISQWINKWNNQSWDTFLNVEELKKHLWLVHDNIDVVGNEEAEDLIRRRSKWKHHK